MQRAFHRLLLGRSSGRRPPHGPLFNLPHLPANAAAAAATAVRWALPAAVDPALMDVKQGQQAKARAPSVATSMRTQQDKLFEEYVQKQQEAPKEQHLGWVWKDGNYVWQDKKLAH